MAQSARTIPANFPGALATHLLKADAQRQISIVRQEVVTDLLTILAEAREPNTRKLLIRLIEANLRSGVGAAKKAEDLWPEPAQAQAMIEQGSVDKPSAARKYRKLFEQLDRVQRRSLQLLHDSFENIQLILDRLERISPFAPPPNPPPASPQPQVPRR